MIAKSAKWWTGVCAAVMSLGMLASAGTQSTGTTLGSVRLTRGVTADGQPLAAGTYTLRLSDAAVSAVVGQPQDSEQWIEFVQNGQVRGRELATKVAAADVQAIAKTTPPASGTARVERLKSGDYIRIWVNRSGTHYLLHLATTPS